MTTLTEPLAQLLGPGDRHPARILDGARDAFLEFGIRRTTMGEIGRRCGLSPATLYRRFAGKDELVWAVGRREVRRLIEDVDAGLDPSAPAGEQIVELSVACMREIRGNALLQRLLATEPEVLLPLLTVQGGPVLELGRAYLAGLIRGLARRAAPPQPEVDADAVAELLARLTLSLALLPQSRIPFDDDAALRTFARHHIVPMLGWTSG